jgi:hypothetical protein
MSYLSLHLVLAGLAAGHPEADDTTAAKATQTTTSQATEHPSFEPAQPPASRGFEFPPQAASPDVPAVYSRAWHVHGIVVGALAGTLVGGLAVDGALQSRDFALSYQQKDTGVVAAIILMVVAGAAGGGFAGHLLGDVAARGETWAKVTIVVAYCIVAAAAAFVFFTYAWHPCC